MKALSSLHTPAIPSLASVLHPSAPRWSNRNQRRAFSLSPQWRDWLLNEQSLTARLSALRPNTFNVQVLAQYYGEPTPTERQALQLYGSQRLWIREVILRLGDVPLVYARTAIPLTTLCGDECRLQHLGARSLGSYLFRQPSLRRTPLQVSHCKANALGLEWSRRSVFTLRGKPLMVSEAFSRRLTEFL
ncbi:MAG: chorismate lyase [Saccharospirillaceae bacterium]|nr:chorismate lyase [Saccharospirillaceae bacterium]MCD8531473.1 chorismate lyase [Saccharospirillaceae bacterium]